MEFLFADWLGTPAWFWLSFIVLVIALGSAAVWVAYAQAPVATAELDWWASLGALPIR